MPRMSGEEAFREMQKIAPEVPVIFCSGYTREAAKIEAESGVRTFFVQKPFERPILTETIKAALGEAEETPSG